MNVSQAGALALAAIAGVACFGSAHGASDTRDEPLPITHAGQAAKAYPGTSEATQRERARIFASLPNWTGIWEAEAWLNTTAAGKPAGGIEELRAKSPLMGHPPYNAAWEAQYQANLKNIATISAESRTRKSCSFAFPLGMDSPAIFQVAVTPEETLFVFVTQDVRHIYTDGRSHPPEDELWPTRMGDSIGHWEGQTLVIETVARLATGSIALASPISKLSEQAKFTERVRMVSEGVLENEMTIEDPVALERPWTVKIRYHRSPVLKRMMNWDCTENDRNPVVDGKLTVAPP